MSALRTLLCVAASVSLSCLAASAQEMVHATQGTVSSTSTGSLSLQAPDGSGGTFKELSDSDSQHAVAKDLRTVVTPADKFSTNGNHVVLLFEGYGDTRTAVAVRDLGTAPVTTTTGAVEHFDKHVHELTLKTADGKTINIKLDEKTIADTPNGVTDGTRFDPPHNSHVTVAIASNTPDTAVLITQLQ